jgi:outer membrane protein assembly factor BamB
MRSLQIRHNRTLIVLCLAAFFALLAPGEGQAFDVSPTSLNPSCQPGQNAANGYFIVYVWDAVWPGPSITISDDVTWLSVTRGSNSGVSNDFDVHYATSALAVGTYTGHIYVDVEGAGFGKIITVTLTVTSNVPVLSVSPTSLSPTCPQGQNPGPQSFTVRNTGAGTLEYTITQDQTWFSCTPTSGTSTGEPDTITVNYTTSALAEGTYTGTITVTAPGATGSPRTIAVSLTVTANPPVLYVTPTSLSPSCQQGQNAANQSFTVRNTGGGTLSYTITQDQTWFSCTPASGTSTGETDTLTVNYATSGLVVGTYTGTITVTAPGATGSPRTIAVSLTVTPNSPILSVSPASLSPSCQQGQNAAKQSFTVQNTGVGTLSYTITKDQPWFSCTPTIGISTGEQDIIVVNYATKGLAVGTYTGTITVTAPGVTGSPRTIALMLTVVKGLEGTLKWERFTAQPVRSSPGIGADGTIYVGSNDHNLYALNPDGTQKWAFATGNWVTSSPAIGADGAIYVGSNDHGVYALNPDGTRKWVFVTGGEVHSSPAIGTDGTIYVGSYDHKLYAVNPDGTQKWAFATGGVVYSSPAIGADGTIYMASGDGNLYAINRDGTQKWALVGAAGNSPAIGADGTIYVGRSSELIAVNPDGTRKWAFEAGTSEWLSSSPVIGIDGTIYVGSTLTAPGGKLYAINPDSTQKWAFATGRGVGSSPAIGADGTIYVGSTDGYAGGMLYALNPDGSQNWASTIGSIESSPAIGADGTIYVGAGYDLYAVYSSSQGLAKSPWPMFHHDVRHTGRVQPNMAPIISFLLSD